MKKSISFIILVSMVIQVGFLSVFPAFADMSATNKTSVSDSNNLVSYINRSISSVKATTRRSESLVPTNSVYENPLAHSTVSKGILTEDASPSLTKIETLAGRPYFELVLDETRGWIYGSDSDGNKIDVLKISNLTLLKSIRLPGVGPRGIALSPDGKELAIAQYNKGSIIFINPVTGETKATTELQEASPKPWDVVYGRPGRLYAIGSPFNSQNGVHVIDTDNHVWVSSTTPCYAGGCVWGPSYLEISSDGNTLYSNDGNNHFLRFDVSSDTIPAPVTTNATNLLVGRYILTPDGKKLITSAGQVWDSHFRAQISTIIPNDYTTERFITYLPKHNAAAIVIDDLYGFGDQVIFVNINTFYVMSIYSLPRQLTTLGAVAATSDGGKLIISSSRGMISIDLSSFPPGEKQPLPKGSTNYFDLVADDARQVLYGSNTNGHKLDIISMSSGNVVRTIRFTNGASPKGMDMSPDGKELAVALNGGGSIVFINLDTKRIVSTIYPDTRLSGTSAYRNNKPFDVIYGRQGRLYTTGSPYSSGSDYIHVIDTNTHREIGRSTYVIRDGPSLAISSDKNTLYVNDDTNVSPQKFYKFDVTTDSLPDPVKSPHVDWLHAKKFLLSEDDNRIFTNTGQVWDSSLKGVIGNTGQAGNLALLPTHNAIATTMDTPNADAVVFSNNKTFYGIRKYSLSALGVLGAITASSDGNKLFISSEKGMTILDLSSGLPGTAIPLPTGKLPYYDMVIDEARGVLYGSDSRGHKIDVISMASLDIVKSYRLVNGATPLGMDLSPDGKELAVAQNGASSIIFLNPQTGNVLARLITDTTNAGAPWEVGDYNVPQDVIYGRQGRLYSTGSPTIYGLDYLHVINTDTHTEIGKSDFYIRSVNALGKTSNGDTLYVNLSSQSPQEILQIDVTSDTPIISLDSYHAEGVKGFNFLLTPDDSKIFMDSGQVWNSTLNGKIGMVGQAGYLAMLSTHNAVAIAEDGGEADSINFFSLEDYYGIKTYSLGNLGKLGPMAAKLNGSRLYLSTEVGMIVVNLSSGLPGNAIPFPAGQLPYFDLVADEARGVLYGSNMSGHKIDVISMSTLEIIDEYRLVNGASPAGIALSPDGSELAIAEYGASTIAFLDPTDGHLISSIIPNNYSLNRPYDVIYGRPGFLYSTGSPYSYGSDAIHVFDTGLHTEIGKSTEGPRSYPSMAISSDGNTLYVIETYQSPEKILRFDVSANLPVNINSTSMNFTNGISTFTLMESENKVLVSAGKVLSLDLTTNYGTFTPGGQLEIIPSKGAFLSVAGKTITYFNATTNQSVGTSTLPGVTSSGPVVVLSDETALFVTTDTGIKKISLSVFPPAALTKSFNSVGTRDGWTLESAEDSNVGGTMNASGNLLIGDDSQDKQYRVILSFNTASLPDNAAITKVVLRIKKQGQVGNNPFQTHGILTSDVCVGNFGNSALEVSDFQNPSSKNNLGKFIEMISSPGKYQLVLGDIDFQYINLAGVTQFRLRFNKEDNDNNSGDFIQFYSGDDSVAAENRPILIVEYVLP